MCVLARDRGLRRECRDGHGTRTPDSELAAVIGDLGGLFFFFFFFFHTFNCSELKDEVSLKPKKHKSVDRPPAFMGNVKSRES